MTHQPLFFSVTNDLSYDQRMIRICTTLAEAGYKVTLVGRKMPHSKPLKVRPFSQKRLDCFFTEGPMFYAEFNTRLFFYLLFRKASLLCAIDADAMLPVFLVSTLRKIPRVYDAHELFSEMKEVVTRPAIHRFWRTLESWLIPKFPSGYTVNTFISAQLNQRHGVNYEVIRNLPVYTSDLPAKTTTSEKTILYQGAVNEARCFESLIPAMLNVNAKLIVCGDGNFMQQAKKLVASQGLEDKITFTGLLDPDILKTYTRSAYIGVNIIEDSGLNNRFSLSNRFFDYIQAALPQICVGYPAYRDINDKYECAFLISDTSPTTIACALNHLLSDHQLYQKLKEGCLRAREHLNWNNEKHKLISFYNLMLPL